MCVIFSKVNVFNIRLLYRESRAARNWACQSNEVTALPPHPLSLHVFLSYKYILKNYSFHCSLLSQYRHFLLRYKSCPYTNSVSLDST